MFTKYFTLSVFQDLSKMYFTTSFQVRHVTSFVWQNASGNNVLLSLESFKSQYTSFSSFLFMPSQLKQLRDGAFFYLVQGQWHGSEPPVDPEWPCNSFGQWNLNRNSIISLQAETSEPSLFLSTIISINDHETIH